MGDKEVRDWIDQDIELIFYEPHCTGGSCAVTISAKKAIEYRRGVNEKLGHPEISDENLLLDFMAVFWAEPVRQKETLWDKLTGIFKKRGQSL